MATRVKCEVDVSDRRHLSEIQVKMEVDLHISPAHEGEQTPMVAKAVTRGLKCDLCDKYLCRKYSLLRHLLTHTGVKPHHCTECGHDFAHKETLTEHIRAKHTGQKPYKCTVCDKRFVTKSRLITHFRTHTGQKPYQCTECKKAFMKKSHLTKHFHKHTDEQKLVQKQPKNCSERIRV